MTLTPLGALCGGRRRSAEDEREGEAQDRDRLEQAAGLRLARHTVDVRGEDEADANTRADRCQAVAEDREAAAEVDGAVHLFLVVPFVPSLGGAGRGTDRCSGAAGPPSREVRGTAGRRPRGGPPAGASVLVDE